MSSKTSSTSSLLASGLRALLTVEARPLGFKSQRGPPSLQLQSKLLRSQGVLSSLKSAQMALKAKYLFYHYQIFWSHRPSHAFAAIWLFRVTPLVIATLLTSALVRCAIELNFCAQLQSIYLFYILRPSQFNPLSWAGPHCRNFQNRKTLFCHIIQPKPSHESSFY